jgi:putative DNA primase/helicase
VTVTDAPTMLVHALAYARRGWHVLPLHSIGDDGRCTCRKECASPGKHPRWHEHDLAHGLHDATIGVDLIGRWWKRWPAANIGIRTGDVSGLIAVDVDSAKDGEESLDALIETHEPFPATLTALTGGDGFHYLFAHPGIDVGNTAEKRLGRGLDARGDGGYIVAAPSLHVSGQRYEWLDIDTDVAPAPEWLVKLLTDDDGPPRPSRGSGPPAPYAPAGGTTPYAAKALAARVDEVRNAPNGQRNATLNEAAFRLGMLVAGGQITEADVIEALTAAATAAGLGTGEILATVRSGLTSGARDPQYPDPKFSPRPVASAQRGDAPPTPATERGTAGASSAEAAPATHAGTRAPARPRSEPTDDASTDHVAVSEGAAASAVIDNDEPPEQKPPRPPPTLEGHDEDDDPDGEINDTDLGNARRLIRNYGREVRYAPHLKGWFRWDGRRWAHDLDGQVHRYAHATAQSILTEAAGLTDREDAKKRTAWSFKSEAARQLDAMVRIAERLRGVPISSFELDADPWLFNALNGTIDLRTREIRPHEPKDLLTKLAPVVYDPDAQDDRWDAYLESAIPDGELREWVQRGAGYTLTGLTIEELLFFVHGPTRAGKSTFLEAFKACLGDYARNADFETFLDSKRGAGSATQDIARLAGARLVASNEIDEGRKLAEGLVKTLTGGDTITARFMYSPDFEFSPAFKLWLAANHKPKVRHGDDAIWRRIRLVPFVHPPAKPDSGLKAYLSHNPKARSAILRWAVDGCAAWQERGLRTVAAVREATEAYRAEMDPLAEFFADHCAFGDHETHWVISADLRKAYEEWANEQGIRRTLSPNHFSELLDGRECHSDRRRIAGKPTRIWRGLRLLSPAEDPQQLPGIAVTPGTQDENEGKRDERDRRSGSSKKSPMRGRTGEEILETPERTERASRQDATGETAPAGTSRESVPVDRDLHLDPDEFGRVLCAGDCGRMVSPTPEAVESRSPTRCYDCFTAESF